jgi:SAM-dependent methyltransferase
MLDEVAEGYPPEIRDAARRDIPRVLDQVGFVIERVGWNIALADVGGGVGIFSIACALAGMRTTLIDDFADPINRQIGDDVLATHRRHGITVMHRDVIQDGLGLTPGSMDAITTFDSMEHWHNSPKALFAEIRAALRPGGVFILGVPNSVNLRKRLGVPLGKGKWSAMADWYEQPIFRGHVREADVGDLHYIAADMGLRDIEIRGRNWLGRYSESPMIRRLSVLTDPILRSRPSLCSDLYLIGSHHGIYLAPNR